MTDTSLLRLAGAPNFRDIGGCLTMDGRRLKREKLFRSGELSRLSDADLATLQRLSIAFVLDLRSPQEGGLHPSRWPVELASEVHRAYIHPDITLDGRSVLDHIIEDPTPANVKSVVCRSFGPLADYCGPALTAITERLSRGTAPVVFHCTNGRDRTGVIAAMLLYMLGASREFIVADFLLTNQRIDVELVVENSQATFRKALGMEVDRAIVELCTLVYAEQIDALFQHLKTEYGSPDSYLREFGIDVAMQNALREALLESV